MSYEASKTVVSSALFSNKLLLLGVAIAALASFSAPILDAQVMSGPPPQITYRWEATVISNPVPYALFPNALAVDTSGNVYIADEMNKNALKETLQPDGSYVSSVIVSGLNLPQGIAVDTAGNVYIADSFNKKVLKTSPNSDGSYSSPTTVASGIDSAVYGVVVDVSGNVYFTVLAEDQVYKVTYSAGAYGIPQQIGQQADGFNSPLGIAVDGSGNLYIANQGNHNVMKETWDATTQKYTVTTISTPGLTSPSGIAVDPSGNNIYVADMYIVVKETWSGSGYTQTTLADGATELVHDPLAVALDSSGNIYIGDPQFYYAAKSPGYPAVMKETLSGAGPDVGDAPIDGAGPLSLLTFLFNDTVTLNATTPLMVLTNGANREDFIDASAAVVSTQCTANTTFTAGQYCQVFPEFAPWMVSGTRNGAVVLFDSSGAPIVTAYMHATALDPQVAFLPGTEYSAETGVNGVQKVAVDDNGNIYTNNGVSVQMDVNNTLTQIGNFQQANAIAVDGSGNLYVTDPMANQLRKETLNLNGSYGESLLAQESYALYGVAVDGAGNVYFTGGGGNVFELSPTSGGGYTESSISTSAGNQPLAIAVDGGGNLYIADFTNARVLKETRSASGYTESVAADNNSSPYPLSGPLDVAVDGNGNVYILDSTNDSVIRETPSGGAYVQSLVVQGGAIYGFGQLMGIAVDPFGNVYIADNTFAKVVWDDIYDPPRIYFETVTDGSTSQPQSVQVINNGNQTLTAVSPGLVVAGSTNAGDFIQVPGSGTLTDCAANFSLAPGLACNLGLEFAPSSGESGTITGAATLTDNNLDGSTSPQAISLTGTAQVASQAPTITSTNNTTFTAGTYGSFTVTASGTPAPTFIEGGAIPSGVTFNATSGVLSGTPASGTGGTYNITFKATNGIGTDATQNFTLTVDEAPAITPPSSATFTVGSLETFMVMASGYPAPTLSESGTLPSGVTFTPSTGALSGTPASGTGATYNITFKATNGIGTDATQNFALTVNQAPGITSASSTTFKVGAAGSFTVAASGYPAPTIGESGSLPSGVTFNAGVLSGTPAAGTGGSYGISFTASNGLGSNATQSFILTVNQAPVITSASSTTFTVGAAGSFTVAASGYPAPTIGEIGSLPSGVTFNAGILSGTPASGSAGSYPITITASNGVSPNATQNFTLTVQSATGTITLSPASMPAGTVGSSYRQTVTASGGKAPYRYTISSGTLPSGLTLTTAGVLSGMPVANGSFGFTVKATDAKGATGSQAYKLVMNPPVILLTPITLPAGRMGRSYGQMITASGGIAPYTYTVSSGTLPSGLSLMKPGVLYGTPSASGTFNFTITATDSKGFTGSRAYTVFINPPTIALSPTSLPPGTVGRSYRQTLTASGGIAPYAYAVSSGALPSGLNLTKAGILSGTPTVSGAFTFTITAKDSSTGGPYAGSQSYSLVVNKARP